MCAVERLRSASQCNNFANDLETHGTHLISELTLTLRRGGLVYTIDTEICVKTRTANLRCFLTSWQ